MTPPSSRRSLACLLAAGAAALGTLSAPQVSVAAESGGSRTPLAVNVETLTPAVIPASGRVTLTGVVTNRSKQSWTDLNVYMLISRTPIETRSELAEQAGTSAAASVGDRVTDDGLFDQVGDLAPGESVPYRLSVPRTELEISGAPGVYWVGVHVLGGVDGVRDTVADGRARTFMPLLPPNAARTGTRTRLALLVPVEQAVRRAADTRLLHLGGWQRSVQADGRLDRLLNLSGRADQPITWVVDPAVLDAVQSVAEDNPALDSGPDSSVANGAGPSGDPSPSSSPSPSESSSDGAGDDPSADLSPAAISARLWLAEFGRQAGTHAVVALPYGDLDVASVLRNRFDSLYRRATGLSRRTMAQFGVPGAAPVVVPNSGYLPRSALRRMAPGSTVVLDSQAVPEPGGAVVAPPGRAPIVLADSAAGGGGPRPNARYGALAVRQRLLSEAALHAMSSDRGRPLVVSTPDQWNPGAGWGQANFFAALHQPWLRMVDLPTVAADGGGSSDAARAPVYPRAERPDELPVENLQATRALVRAGKAYVGLLSANDTVDGVLSRVAMLASSQHGRTDPTRARTQAVRTTNYVRAQMRQVRLEGPPFVMMSGESGPVQITVVNGLDQPVTVGIRSETSSKDLSITDVEPVTLGPGRRTAIRLNASSHDIGVHPVTLIATTADGTPLGSQTQFTVRTSHVSTVIWVIMGVGGGLLFLAITVRLVRRIRRRKATHGPLLARDRAGSPNQPNQPSGQELNA